MRLVARSGLLRCGVEEEGRQAAKLAHEYMSVLCALRELWKQTCVQVENVAEFPL